MEQKLIVPNMIISGELTAYSRELIKIYENNGADALLLFDWSQTDEEHDGALSFLREAAQLTELPIFAGGTAKRFEDVKKLLYAGAAVAVINMRDDAADLVLEESYKRFGKEKLAVYTEWVDDYIAHREYIDRYADFLISKDSIDTDKNLLLIENTSDPEELARDLSDDTISGVSGDYVSQPHQNLFELKHYLAQQGIAVGSLKSALTFDEFELNKDGLLPVVVQDDATNEVLMVAYMNEEAFETTIRTGKMTYYSRSRQELWVKGETSGNLQFVRSLSIDCDRDTLLAKVRTLGPACHTGHNSCFYTPITALETVALNSSKQSKEYAPSADDDPEGLRVFLQEYATILDRKEHPKEGSYTNYMFDKGIDKILKKLGEEATEIIIAAKNPDPEEIKYEMADFLYHAMVLMVEKNLTWAQITEELSRR